LTLLGGETMVENHLRIDITPSGSDRDHVVLLAEASIRYIQEITGRTFVDGTATVDLKNIPDVLVLPFKASSLTSIKYFKDTNTGASSALSNDDFRLYTTTSPSVIKPRSTFTIPSDVSESDPFPYQFTFATAADEDSLGQPSQVPRTFIVCALIYLSHLYENRQAVTSGGFRPYVMPLAFESLVKTLKRYP